VFGSNEPVDLGLGGLLQFSSTNALSAAPGIQVTLLPGTNVTRPRVVLGSNWLSWNTNFSVPFLLGTNAPMTIGEGKPLVPGAYMAQPYSMLVIVPAAGGDDKMIVNPSPGAIAEMPVIEPKVELVPWPAAVRPRPGK
jgi:hypothetical protein